MSPCYNKRAYDIGNDGKKYVCFLFTEIRRLVQAEKRSTRKFLPELWAEPIVGLTVWSRYRPLRESEQI